MTDNLTGLKLELRVRAKVGAHLGVDPDRLPPLHVNQQEAVFILTQFDGDLEAAADRLAAMTIEALDGLNRPDGW
jgi:hypothetical protein